MASDTPKLEAAPFDPKQLATVEGTLAAYDTLLRGAPNASIHREIVRDLGRRDLFFLLIYLLGADYAKNQWVLDRCREVKAQPNGVLDLWAREHFKSTIITFALTIQDILNDPEVTVGIFSHTRDIAKGFLRQIKREFEQNDLLKATYPDVLWDDPKRQASKWSENDGIIVRRRSNPKEATVEAWGLTDGQPTSRHYSHRIYDDVVTRDSVRTAHQIAETTAGYQLSSNLGKRGGVRRLIGTRYHLQDTYKTIIEEGIPVRTYPATKNGKPDGIPVLLTRDELREKRVQQGIYHFSCQMLQNPMADGSMGFHREWIKHRWEGLNLDGLNIYIVVDPSSGKKTKNGKESDLDFTAMAVIGIDSNWNKYVIALIRERLRLQQRARVLLALHRKYQPIAVGYEDYGMQADIQYLEGLQAEVNHRFPITALGGSLSKHDRIMGLVPEMEAGKWWFLQGGYHVKNRHGETEDVQETFLKEEFDMYPMAAHDDMLDCLARIYDQDLNVTTPANPPVDSVAATRSLSSNGAGSPSPWAG